ncbi:MAG TPA: hypothetical protein VK611_17020 [Acidimicrobiales bacterium]|nr:hypothetical protein [Acidimicrobiales bacterium]
MSTCQHCGHPVTFGQTEHGHRGFVHEATGTTECPASAATAEGDPDEFEVPADHRCADCGHLWPDHQGDENGVSCTRCDCTAFNYVPPGWGQA